MSNSEREAGMQTEIERLRSENAELHKRTEEYKSTQEIGVAFVASSRDEMTKMSQQLAVLKAETEKDRARLDWIEASEASKPILEKWNLGWTCTSLSPRGNKYQYKPTAREAIDNAMEVTK